MSVSPTVINPALLQQASLMDAGKIKNLGDKILFSAVFMKSVWRHLGKLYASVVAETYGSIPLIHELNLVTGQFYPNHFTTVFQCYSHINVLT
jgi:uncharacterized membrane protein